MFHLRTLVPKIISSYSYLTLYNFNSQNYLNLTESKDTPASIKAPFSHQLQFSQSILSLLSIKFTSNLLSTCFCIITLYLGLLQMQLLVLFNVSHNRYYKSQKTKTHFPRILSHFCKSLRIKKVIPPPPTISFSLA